MNPESFLTSYLYKYERRRLNQSPSFCHMTVELFCVVELYHSVHWSLYDIVDVVVTL